MGYNPQKPGRPSHNYHTHFMGSPRVVFVRRLDSGPVFEYVVPVTNEALPIVGLAQLYRDRADCENVFDEIKNPWGWAGFVTRGLKRRRIIARLVAPFHNWRELRSS